MTTYKTYAEYLRTPEFRHIRSQVMARSNGKCERCGKRPPTEPHHLSYPKWGSFDQPPYDNLVAVCHQCHAEIHGKDD